LNVPYSFSFHSAVLWHLYSACSSFGIQGPHKNVCIEPQNVEKCKYLTYFAIDLKSAI
jgi:hypothetical protein